MKNFKIEVLIISLITIFMGILGYSVFKDDFSISLSVIAIFFAITGIYIAYFFPDFFCYLIIIFAPLSINLESGLGLSLSLPAEGMLGLLLLLSVVKAIGGLKFNKKIILHPISFVLFASILWMLFVSVNSSIPEVSFKRIILKISFILGFYLVFSHLFLQEKNQNKLFLLYAIGLIIPIINSLINHSQFNFSQEKSFEMTEPFYEDHTLYGACLAFIIPFIILYSINKIKQNSFSISTFFWIILSSLIIIAEILSYSRAAWISIIGAFFFFFLTFLKIKSKHFLYLGFIFITVFALNFSSIYNSIKSGDNYKDNDNIENHLSTVTNLKSNDSNLERINRWVCAYRMFIEKPIAGWGPGTYQFQYSKFQTQEFTTQISSNNGDKGNSHSEYLTYLAEEGIIGFSLFILLIILTISTSLNLLNKIVLYKNKILLYGFFLGLITFYSHGLFNAFSDYEKMSILVYGSIAGIVAIDIKHKSKKT